MTLKKMPLRSRPGLAPAKHISASLHSDGVLFLDLLRGIVISGNLTAARIWRAATVDGNELDRLASEMSHDTGAPLDKIQADIEAFVASLRQQGLLQA